MDTSGYWRSGVSRRRFLGATAAAGAGLAGAALIGCSSSGGGNKPATNTPAGPSAGAAKGPTLSSIVGKNFAMREPDGVPKYGGSFNYASGTSAVPNLDPFSSTAAMTHQVASMAYSHLLHNSHPANNRNTLEYYPDIATSWEIGDPTKFVFKLRDGVKFHNVAPLNGRPLTAEDVKFAINRSATDKQSPYRGTLAAIKSIDTPDASTLVLNLNNFDAGLFPALADRFAWITPKELVDSGQLKQTMIGTGPFIFQKWEQDSRINYKRNPDYYIKGAPFVDEMNFLQITDAQTRLAGLRAGSIQTGGVDRNDFDGIVNDKNIVTELYIAVGTSSIMMNYTEPKFKDDRVRQAISLIGSPDEVLKIQADPKGQWRGILSAQTAGWALSQDELKDPKYFLKQDLQKAKQLMTAAGFPDGLTTKYLYRSGVNKAEEDLPQYIAETAKKAGIANLQLIVQDSATMRKNQDEHKYEGLISGIDGEPTPEAFLVDFHTGGPKNGMALSDKDLDAKIDKAISIPDTNARKEAVLNLTREMLQKVYWKRNFTDNTSNDQWRANVHNYLGPLPQQYNENGFTYVWLT